MLGQLFGLTLKNCLITNYKISFTTNKPLEARKFLDLSNEMLHIKENEFIYYLEDIQYGKDDSAIDKFKLFIPNLLSRQVYFFHRPEKSQPQLTITYYSEALPKIILSMLKQLPVLQRNRDFSKGLIDACISNSDFNNEKSELFIENSDLNALLMNSFSNLGIYYELRTDGLHLINFHDLIDIRSFSDISRGKLHYIKIPVKE